MSMFANIVSENSEMTCKSEVDNNDQDEWTPYVAFPWHHTKEILPSYPMKCKHLSRDMVWEERLIPSEEIYSVFEKHTLTKLDHGFFDCLEKDSDNDKQMNWRKCLNEYRSLDKFSNEKTQKVWIELKKRCRSKSRIRWQDSLENDFFLKTLAVEKKSATYFDKNRDVSEFNLQRCTCKEFEDRNKNKEILHETIESDEECSSPCFCTKYFISKSGLVFGSFEEKQCFDEKMDKLDEVFKSELRTIKEQHERLKIDFIPKAQNNDP